MLYGVYNIADIDVVPEYKADMGAGMGRSIYRSIQVVHYRKVFIKS